MVRDLFHKFDIAFRRFIPAERKEVHMDLDSSKERLRVLFTTWARHDIACNVQKKTSPDPCNCGLDLARGRFTATLAEMS